MPANWVTRLRQLLPVTWRKPDSSRDEPLGDQPAMTPEQEQQWAKLLDRLGVVDPQGAVILSLRFEEGLTPEQVAERLQIKASHVRSKEHAAVAWLRRQR